MILAFSADISSRNFLLDTAMMIGLCTPQQALKREIEEELDTEIAVGNLVGTIEYDYPAFHLSMDCFWCEVVSGDLVLKEAEAARWLTKDDIDSVLWLPADRTILDIIRSSMVKKK